MAVSVIRGGNATDVIYQSDHASGVSKYTPELYAAKALKHFYEVTVFGSIANTDYAGEIKNQGDKVWIRTTPVIAITDYIVDEPILDADYENPTSTARELNIDQGLMWAFQQQDVDDVQSAMNVMNMASSDAGERMAIKVDANVLKFIAIGDAETDASTSGVAPYNFGTVALPGCGAISKSIDMGISESGAEAPRGLNAIDADEDNIIRAIVDCSQVLDEQNIPQAGRWIVLPAWACALLKSGDLRRADITGDSTGVIRNGVIGMVDNFTIYRSNNLHVDSSGNTFIPFGINDAVTFASQFVKSESLRIQSKFGDYYRGLNIFGRAIVQPTAVGLLYAKRAV